MSTSNSNRLDDDILQCKADILRSRDLVPPFGPKKPNPSGAADKQPAKIADDAGVKVDKDPEDKNKRLRQQAVLSGQELSALLEDQQQDRAGIPEFDLDKQIMAKERKIIAIRRKAPGQKDAGNQPKPQEQAPEISRLTPYRQLPQRQRIITKIVAEDIEQLCNCFGREVLV